MLVLLAGVVLCRTYWVGQQTAYAASAGGQSVQTLTLPRARGDFYDRTGRRLTGPETPGTRHCFRMSRMRNRVFCMSAATLQAPF